MAQLPPNLLDRSLRMLGCTSWIPRKVRSLVITSLVGRNDGHRDRRFTVDFYQKRYSGTTASHIDWLVYYFGAYDEHGINLLRHLASQFPQESIYLDVGANTGTHTLALADLFGEVHCFEPYPPAIVSLKQHVSENQLDHVTIHETGLSDTNQTAPFFANQSCNHGAGTFRAKDRNPDSHLPLAVGDELVQALILPTPDEARRIRLIKIDIEGMETQAIRGLNQTIREHCPVVVWEWNVTHQSSSWHDIVAEFPEDYQHFKIGFRSRWTRATPVLHPLKDDQKTGNFVSFPASELELAKGLIQQDDNSQDFVSTD